MTTAKEGPHKKIDLYSREECESVPDGVSCTETEAAYYLRIRPDNKNCYLTIRVDKKHLINPFITTYWSEWK